MLSHTSISRLDLLSITDYDSYMTVSGAVRAEQQGKIFSRAAGGAPACRRCCVPP